LQKGGKKKQKVTGKKRIDREELNLGRSRRGRGKGVRACERRSGDRPDSWGNRREGGENSYRPRCVRKKKKESQVKKTSGKEGEDGQ